MKELEQNLQEKRQYRSSLKQQIREQLGKEMAKIDNLLNIADRMRGVRKIIKQCGKFMKENQDREKQQKLIWKYDPKLDYEFQQFDVTPKLIQRQEQMAEIQLQLRSNWIQKYLDRSDVKILGNVKGQRAKIISEKNNVVNYQIVDSSQNQQNLLTENQILSQSLKELQNQNKKLKAIFFMNKYLYNLNNHLIKMQVNQYQQTDKQNTTLVMNLRHNLYPQSNSIRRILILKKKDAQQQQQMLLSPRSITNSKKQYKYEIYEGFYQSYDFTISIDLSRGTYIFIPFSNTNFTIYSQNTLQLQYIPQKQRTQLKQLNLMLQSFPQCHPQNIKAQFIRQIDLSAGIVIDIYKNQHENQIYFKQITDKTHTAEDKRLMFRSLYSDRHRNYRLNRGQIIVEFYQVTAKPAVLYQPQKRVFIDKQELYDAKTVHSILK